MSSHQQNKKRAERSQTLLSRVIHYKKKLTVLPHRHWPGEQQSCESLGEKSGVRCGGGWQSDQRGSSIPALPWAGLRAAPGPHLCLARRNSFLPLSRPPK